MMSDKKRKNFTATTIEAIQQMGQGCKVVLTKLTPAQVDKYTRLHHEAESFEGNKVINKSRKRKHTHFSCQVPNSIESKCMNNFNLYNFKENPTPELHSTNHQKTEIPTSKENSTELDESHKLSKTLKCQLKNDCLDSCFHNKRRKEFDDHYNDHENEHETNETEHEIKEHSGFSHVSTTINLNIYCNGYESGKNKNKGSNTVVNSTHEIADESPKKSYHNKIHVSHMQQHKSSKKYSATLSKLAKITESKNSTNNKTNDKKLSFESNTENNIGTVFQQKSTKLKGLKELTNLDTTNRFHIFNQNNKNRNCNNRKTSPKLDPNHKIETMIENQSEIHGLNVPNDVTKNDTTCHMTKQDSLTNVDNMSLSGLDKISTTNSSKRINVISNNETNASILVNTNNIGKIRVKDPKSLGIQSFGIDNLNDIVNVQTSGPLQHTRQLVENLSVEELVSRYGKHNFKENDITVFNNYKKHFNDLVESKLPKMGELLHLAVADFVRKDERIQRSEKLSSPDLIKQEKLKAEREFSDILQTRGTELSILLETTVNTFDKDCAEDLMLALYCRVLDMFLMIDKQNKKHVVRARYILHKILHKSNYKNDVVCKILSMKGSEFSQRLSRMSHYVLTYNNLVNATCGNNESKTQSSLHSSVKLVSDIETNILNENTTKSTNFSNISKSESGPVLYLCNGTDTNLSSQQNGCVNLSAFVPDHHNQLSTTLSNLPISGNVNTSTLNLNSLTPTSFAINSNKHVADNHESNIDSDHYKHSGNNETAINNLTETQHKIQTDFSICQNPQAVNDLQCCMQVESANRIPLTQIPVNCKTRTNDLRNVNNSINYMSLYASTASQNYSRRFTPNMFYSHQNQSCVPSTVNNDSIKTAKIQMKTLPKDVNNATQNTSNILPLTSEILQVVDSFTGNNSQRAVRNPRNHLHSLPYIYSPGPELLQKILSNLNTSNASCSETDHLKKIIEDKIYLSKHSVDAGNENILSEVLTQQNMKEQSTTNNLLRTVDGRNRSCPLQPYQYTSYNSNSNDIAGINPALRNGYIERITIANKNQGTVSQNQIYPQMIDAHRSKNYRQTNVPIAPKPVTHKFLQTVTVDKTHYESQNKLPVINDVFSCSIRSADGQNLVLPTEDSVAPVVANCNNETTIMHSSSTNGLTLPRTRNVFTYALTSNYLQPSPVFSNKFQTVLQSNTSDINTSSTVNNGDGNVFKFSVPSLLPHDNTSGFRTPSYLLRHFGSTALLAPSDNKADHVTSPIAHNLQRSVSRFNLLIPIVGYRGITGTRMEFQTLTCTRPGCSQKSNKLCSVCKRVTYCSLECQTEDWYDGHVNVCHSH